MPKSKRSQRVRRGARGRKAAFATAVTTEQPLVAVPRTVRRELKYYSDAVSTFASVGNSVVNYACFAKLNFGTGVNQRLGQAVLPKSLSIEGTLNGGQSNLAADDAVNTFRIASWLLHHL